MEAPQKKKKDKEKKKKKKTTHSPMVQFYHLWIHA